MRSMLSLAAIPVLALAATDGPPPRNNVEIQFPEISAPQVYCDVVADLRPQDPRVSMRLIDEASALNNYDARTQVLMAVARNPTISPDAELRLIEEARKLNNYDLRRDLLVTIASSLRVRAYPDVAPIAADAD